MNGIKLKWKKLEKGEKEDRTYRWDIVTILGKQRLLKEKYKNKAKILEKKLHKSVSNSVVNRKRVILPI